MCAEPNELDIERVIMIERIVTDFSKGWSWSVNVVRNIHSNGVVVLEKCEASAISLCNTPEDALRNALHFYDSPRKSEDDDTRITAKQR